MRFNRFQFAQASTAPKDCTQCKDMKEYGACTCDPDMSSAQPPNAEGCTFVLGNEHAPASNAKPAWSEYATSNTVRAAEGTLERKSKQDVFGQLDCDGVDEGHPSCATAKFYQECDPDDVLCLSQVEQNNVFRQQDDDCDAYPNNPGCGVFEQIKLSTHSDEVMSHNQGQSPDEEPLFDQENVFFKQGAETSASRCFGPSGPECDLDE